MPEPHNPKFVTKPLGQLHREPNLRSIWKHEAHSFTPWLAQDENISALSRYLGLGDEGLEVQAIEHNVGPFRADILCKRTDDGSLVLIENQLAPTDHTHLGQLLTYTAGLKAATVVWIAERFTDEHRAALDWLNETVSDDSYRFFGIEIQLWRIDDGPLAPRFEGVSTPNDWEAFAKSARSSLKGEHTPTQVRQLEYWNAFNAFAEDRPLPFNLVKAKPQNWLSFSIGRMGFNIGSVIHLNDGWIRTELYLSGPNASDFLLQLKTGKAAIESELGPLEWQLLENRRDCRICVYNNQFDPKDEQSWPEQHEWLADTLSQFHTVFHDRIRNLDRTINNVL